MPKKPSHHRPQRRGQVSSDRDGRWVIGIHAVREALKVRPKAVTRFQVRDDFSENQDLKELVADAQRLGFKIERVPNHVLDRFGTGHQGIGLCLNQSPSWAWDEVDSSPQCRVVVLDGVQDPHNLGAVLRTSWLLGVKGVFISEHRSSPLTATACKVASGGAEHVPVVIEGNLPNLLSNLKDKGFWIFGLAAEGRSTIWQQNFSDRVALVIGAEGRGLRTPVERACDELVRIPQIDSQASFNASVAAAISLAEVVRQHQGKG